MRNFILLSLIALFCLVAVTATAQDEPAQLNLPGDNLNLYAVMKLFQDSPTLEEFEKRLNDRDAKINNLDLDGDNNIDYIKVVDNLEGDIHNITLKVAVSKDEDQDVAVFVVKKDNTGQVQMQLIGDEDLYGKDYIIEPASNAPSATPNPGYLGNAAPVEGVSADYQVSSWPVVQFIFVPTYSVWRSPWRWGYYPSYWHPWTPFFWHEYYGYQYHWNYYYRAHYRYTPVYRFPAWRDHYYSGGYRSRSNFVQVRYRAGNYRQTYTRPDLANRGSALFRTDHPTAPSVNRRLPNFDANNNGRPIITRHDVNRPGNNRPGNGNGQPIRPLPDNNSPGRPITTPVDGSNRPNRPVIRPVTNPPETRPINPRPNNEHRPVIRPAVPPPGTPRPGINPPDNRPITRPVTNPPQTRPPINSRPNNENRPVTRPVTNPPEARPINPRPNNENRPVTRPVTPRPQQIRPVPRPVRPPNEKPREKKDGR